MRRPSDRSRLRTVVLIALVWCAVGPVRGAGKDDGRGVGRSGHLLVCKEYGTVRGTFLTDTRGHEVARLNFLFGEDVNPRFSPVDDRILFTSARGGTPGLWTMNRQGQQRRRICDGDQGDWFPDGRRIVLRRQGRVLARSLASGEETVLSPADWKSCSWPACSPDGRTIVFVARDGKRGAIWSALPGRSEPRRLAEGEIPGGPRWSPDGKRIVCQMGAHLFVIDADGSGRRQLTTAGGIQRRPAWSPDGSAIAYNQGPGPKGPWQMAVVSSDGAHVRTISPGDARCVLSSDWGVETPGQKTAVKVAAVPPRVRLWEIERPVAAPADWAAFCRERKGWKAVAGEKGLTGGCAVESPSAVLVVLTGMPGAVLISKPALGGAVKFTLLDGRGAAAGPVESIRVAALGPDEAAVECSSHWCAATWALGGSRALVCVTPGENAATLRVAIPLHCVVVPDRFGNDLVVDAQTLGRRRATLPWAPLVAGLAGDGSEMLVLICPEQGQRADLRTEEGPRLAGVDVAFQGRDLLAGLIACERAWHLERFAAGGTADPLRFKWRMPCPAAWRLAVQGAARRYATFFSDKESAVFDRTDVLFRKGKVLADPRLGLIYLYGRTAATPPETITPMDLLRDALGIAGAERVLDEQGLTGYRRAAGPTTWAEFSLTLDSLRYLFERQLEVQDSVYAGHLCDDLGPLVEGLDRRLEEYADAARRIDGAGTKLQEDLRALGRRQRDLKNARDVAPLAAKIRQLTVKESGENEGRFDECRKALLKIAGPREEILGDYRRLFVEIRDAAADAALAKAGPVEAAEKIRALCQAVLRNRFCAEADWRGEDYEVPAYWLGPRPYQDAR